MANFIEELGTTTLFGFAVTITLLFLLTLSNLREKKQRKVGILDIIVTSLFWLSSRVKGIAVGTESYTRAYRAAIAEYEQEASR